MFSHLNLKQTEIRVGNEAKRNENILSSVKSCLDIYIYIANYIGTAPNRTRQIYPITNNSCPRVKPWQLDIS